MSDDTLVQALKNRKENKTGSADTNELLNMILEQVTKMADLLAPEQDLDDSSDIVTTQESHSP